MIIANLWLALPIALIPILIGFFWYGKMGFHNAWMREAGLTEAEIAGGNMVKIMGLSLLYSFLVSCFVPLFTIHQTSLSGMFGTSSDQWMVAGSELMTRLDGINDLTGVYTHHLHFGHGAAHGLMIALLFVGPIFWINGLFERKSWKYMLIHTGYWAICLTLMGGVWAQFATLTLPMAG